MRIAAALLAALLCTASAADARMHHPWRGHRTGTAVAPLDGFTVPAGAYSFRRLRSNYAGPLAKIRRTTGGTSDIGFTATGDFDTAAATTFCAATTCYIDTLYDQSGNARHLTNAVTAEQPQLIFSCIGLKVCMRGTQAAGGSSGNLTYSTATAGAVTYSSFSRLENTAQTITVYTGGPFLYFNATQIGLYNTSVGFTVPHTPGAWHAMAGTIAGASSNLTVDGVTTAGTLAHLGGAGPAITGTGTIGAAASTTELVFWDASYTMSAAQQVAWTQNQQQYWAPYSLDAFAAPAGAYSFRKLRSSYAGPAVRIRRASDNLELDIGFLGFVPGLGSPVDVAAINTHCAATSCFMRTFYDQSGNARDLIQTTAANQPQLIINCQAGLPCLSMPTVQSMASAGSVTPSGSVTMSLVGTRTTPGVAYCVPFAVSANQVVVSNAPNIWALYGGAELLYSTPADGAWHAFLGTIAGAPSSITLDGAAPLTGPVTLGVAPGTIQTSGGDTCRVAELVGWNSYIPTAGERAALQANQKSFWGTP